MMLPSGNTKKWAMLELFKGLSKVTHIHCLLDLPSIGKEKYICSNKEYRMYDVQKYRDTVQHERMSPHHMI